ncbi:hypothetical protein BS47DRAFT_1369697 [Hydnum rufescens UP504]|uniref:Uncharacterized protein n=1 Tax=Hydnum rufescens UP504 TaxID=1448309 RepID=A0A9P6ACR9_9AGAM|nr:hypothetical protein BS47DRAFT_1369697 [Hydnum rufescens UP504]
MSQNQIKGGDKTSSASDPKPFSTELALKTSSGYLLLSPYHENVTYFLEKNRALYMDWKLVAESLGIPVGKDFVPRLPPSSQFAVVRGLLEDGVPTFGVVEGPMQSGVRSIKELPEGCRWLLQKAESFLLVGILLPGSHEPLEQCLLHKLFPDPTSVKLDPRMIATIRRILGSGPFPPSATEVEITSQIDRLSLEDSNPSTHIPSVPINDLVNDAEDLYAKFWDQSSEGLPYDDYSDISSYDLTPSDAVVKSTRAAKIGERRKQKRVEAEAINEAAQLLSKAQKGDWEAKAEIIQRINAEHGRKNGVRSRDGKPPASPGVVYLWQHFINPDNVESNNRKHEKRLCRQTAEIAEVNAQARLVKTPAGDAQETNASLPGSGTQVQIQHPTPAPACSPPPTHPLQIRDCEWAPTAIIMTSHAFLLVPINHMALYLPHTIFLILILSPVIPLILILVPIPIPIPILILVLISVHVPIPIPVPIPVPVPVPIPIPIPVPVPVPIPILILVPVPVLPSQILVFPPIATVLPSLFSSPFSIWLPFPSLSSSQGSHNSSELRSSQHDAPCPSVTSSAPSLQPGKPIPSSPRALPDPSNPRSIPPTGPRHNGSYRQSELGSSNPQAYQEPRTSSPRELTTGEASEATSMSMKSKWSYAFKNGSRDSRGTSPLNTPSLQEEGVQTSLNFKKSLPVPSAVGTLIMLPFPVKASNSTAPPVEHPLSSAKPFERVPLGQWFYIEWGPLTVGQSNIKDIANGLMMEFTHQGVLGIRCTRRKHISESQRDSVLADFSQEMNKNRFKNLKTSTANAVAHPYVAPVDLLIEQIHDVPIDLKQLEIFLRIHARTGFKQAFIAPIWPNTSQVNTIICQIVRWAETDGLKQGKNHLELQETLGFTLHKCWRLTLEMDLPEPFFLKDPREETMCFFLTSFPHGMHLESSAECSASPTFGVLSCILVEQSCGPIATTSINFISFTYSKTILVELSAGVSVNMVRTWAHPESLDSSQSSTKRPHPSMKGSSSNPKPPSPKAKRPLSKAKVLSSKGTPASSSAKTASNAPASSSPAVPSKASDPLQAVAKAPMFATQSATNMFLGGGPWGLWGDFGPSDKGPQGPLALNLENDQGKVMVFYGLT